MYSHVFVDTCIGNFLKFFGNNSGKRRLLYRVPDKKELRDNLRIIFNVSIQHHFCDPSSELSHGDSSNWEVTT